MLYLAISIFQSAHKENLLSMITVNVVKYMLAINRQFVTIYLVIPKGYIVFPLQTCTCCYYLSLQ